MRKRSRQIAAIVGVIFLAAAPAYPCRCGPAPVCDAFWAADAVFVGTADVIDPDEQRTRFRVEEAFRGVEPKQVLEVLSYAICWSCEYGFRHGKRYLVFANKRPNGGWRAGLCSRTKPVDEAAEDLAYARTANADLTKAGRVYGSVWVPGVGPLYDAAIVELEGRGYKRSTVTNDAGRFEFDGVPAGRYRLSIGASTHFDASTAEIALNGPGACLRHIFNLSRKSRKDRYP